MRSEVCPPRSNVALSHHNDSHSLRARGAFALRRAALALASVFCLALFAGAAQATTFTSTQSGSWGDSATWGSAGVPGCNDDVTVASGTTVQLDTTRCSNNLTIQSGGTLDLNGNQFNFQNDGTTFTNDGSLANTGAFNTFFFFGNGQVSPNNITQTWAGAGTYSGNAQVRLTNLDTVNVSASTTVTFGSATGNTNLSVDGGSTLNLSNPFNFISAASTNNVVIANNGAVSGGLLRLQGSHLQVQANAAVGSPVEIASGSPQGHGVFNGDITVDTGTSFILDSALTANGNLTVQSGGTVDINGSQLNFSGGGKTFTNGGTLTNGSATFNTFFFTGNGNVLGSGGITQTWAGAGTYSPSLQVRLTNLDTVAAAGTLSVTFGSAADQTNLAVDGGSTLDVTNPLSLSAPSSGTAYVVFANNGTTSGAGGVKPQGNVYTQANATIAAPFEAVSGAQKGSGTFNGDFTVDTNTSFQMQSTLIANGSLTIQSGGTVDINGSQLNFQGGGKTFTNGGTLTNTSATFSTFFFFGNGQVSPNNITQTVAGSGTYGSNLQVRLSNFIVVNTASGAAFTGLNSLAIDGGSTLNLTSTFTFTGPTGVTFATITNNGTLTGSTLQTQNNVQLNSNSALEVPLEVLGGTTQSQGTFDKAITVDNTGTFKLTSTATMNGDLTIQSGGTVDINGSQVNFQGGGKTFTNSGTLTNASATFNIFFFTGNGQASPNNISQTWAGAGSYSPNLEVRLTSFDTVAAAGTLSVTFGSAADQTNLAVDGGSTLDVTNPLSLSAPSSGTAYIDIVNNGAVTGAGGVRPQGNVQTVSNAIMSAPFEAVSGAQRGNGSFTNFTVDNAASFKMLSTLDLYGNLTISSGGTVDLFGSQLNLRTDNTTLTNNGALANTGASNTFFFQGNGMVFGSGGFVYHLAASSGTAADNILFRMANDATLVLDGDAQLSAVQVDGGSRFDISNHTLRLSAPGTALTLGGTFVTTGSTVDMDGTQAQVVQAQNLGGSTYNNLEIDNPAGVSLNGGITVPGTLFLTHGTFTITFSGNLTMASGSTISRSGGALDTAPDFAGTVNLAYNDRGFAAPAAITDGPEVPTASATLNNLNIDNPGGVNFNATGPQVNGTMTLARGVVGGTSSVDIGAGGSVTRTATDPATGFVASTLVKRSVTSGFVFHVGQNLYSPVTANSVSGAGDLQVLSRNLVPPGYSKSTPLKRFWTISPVSGSVTARPDFGYPQSDVQGDETRYRIIKDTGGNASYYFPDNYADDVDESSNNAQLVTARDANAVWSVAELPATQPGQTAGDVKISELRFRGPAGARDEFVELYNSTNSDITVGTLDNSPGWALVSSDDPATPKYVIPNSTVIPARGHFLVTNAGTNGSDGYSLGGYAAPDMNGTATYGSSQSPADIPDTGGVALYMTSDPSNFTDPNRHDAAGCTGAPAGFFETAPLQPVTDGGALNVPAPPQFSYTRKQTTGRPQDSDNNANDFMLVSVRPDQITSATAQQGAPGPENTASPVNRGDRVKGHLIDSTKSASADPNRHRDSTPYTDTTPDGTPSDPTGNAPGTNPYAAGTLAIRRRFVNTTGAQLTGLRFRIVDITANGTNAPNTDGTADVRAISSADVTVTSNDPTTCGGLSSCNVTVHGLKVDQEGPMPQTRGGGFNTSMSIDLSGITVLNGDPVDVQFLLGVQQSGSFRFFVIVEALPGVNGPAADLGGSPAPANLNGAKGGGATTPKGGLTKTPFVKGKQ